MNDRGRGITGAIIAGGGATRFAGRPKGLERVGGVRIIDRVAAALRPHCDSLLIAAGDTDASSWLSGAAVARDALTVKASVVGLHAALLAAGSDIIAVAWDMPFVPSSLIGALRAHLAGDVVAVVPRVGGRAEPLCAAYSARAVGDLERLVRGGTLTLTDVIDNLGSVAWLEEVDLARFGDPGIMFFNVNSAPDLERADEIALSLS